MAELKRTELSVGQERAILVGVILPDSTADPRDPLGELESLAQTAGAKVCGELIQRRQRPDPATYLGKGKAIDAARLAAQHKADVIIFDNDLSPAQIGAMESLVNRELGAKPGEGVKILDRSELILDIFATRAQTHEAKLQVELAQMQYTYPRLTRLWGHLERIASGTTAGIGARGPGEQQLEIDRRIVRKRIADLKQEIERIQERKNRQVQQRNQANFTVCLVGYTNAGKSTLFNTLTAAGTYADNRLFATLDTKTRIWPLDHGAEVLLSDTVGFVRDLPHMLVASFKATLQEAVHADLLLHVLDVGHPHAQQQYQSVHQVLEEIGAGAKREILLLNKIDTEQGDEQYPQWRALYPGAIAISARTGRGVADLAEAVYQAVRGEQVEVALEINVADGRLLAYIQANASVQERRFVDSTANIRAIMPRRMFDELSRNPHVKILVTVNQ